MTSTTYKNEDNIAIPMFHEIIENFQKAVANYEHLLSETKGKLDVFYSQPMTPLSTNNHEDGVPYSIIDKLDELVRRLELLNHRAEQNLIQLGKLV